MTVTFQPRQHNPCAGVRCGRGRRPRRQCRTDGQAELETVPVPSENGFRVESDAFADLLARDARAASANM